MRADYTRPSHRSLILALLCGLILCWTASAATVQQALSIDRTRDNYPLGRVLLALEDPQRMLTIEDVAQTANAARFRPALPPDSNVDVNFGYSDSAWWLALPLALDASAAARWLLEIGYPSLDQVEVYVPRPGGGHDKLVAGDLQRFSERPYPHRNLVFPLALTPGQAQTVYLRVVSAGNLTIPATLWQPDALAHHDQQTYSVLSLYYGMLLALGIYNLLLFLAFRDTTFLTYVAFTVSMAIAQASMNGLGNQFMWPEWPAWGNVALPSGMAATGFFGAIFARLFLGTRERAPLLDRCIIGCAVLLAFTAFSPLLLPYRWVAILVSLLGILFSAVAVFGGVYCVRRQHPGARYFLLAWTLLLLGAAVLAMRNLDWLPTTWLTFNAMQIGSALELLLLSFALADRIRGMRREKDLANEAALTVRQQMVEALRKAEHELESRVAERTLTLETLNNQLREKEQQLEHLARHDPLTGLANRILLKDRIERAVTRARRSHNGVALLLVDLDGFKQVNDAYGHGAGDALLVAIAGRLKACVREADTVARLGGDEFVVLLEDTRYPGGASQMADKLIAAVQQPVTLDAGTVQVGASVGIACIPQHANTAEELLERADGAMYAAKAAGRNRWSAAPEIAA